MKMMKRLSLLAIGLICSLSGYGQVPLVGSTLTVNGKITAPPLSTMSFGWNLSNGSGEGDYVNYFPSGVPGGFSWYATSTASLGSPIMTLSALGNMVLNGTMTTTYLGSNGPVVAQTYVFGVTGVFAHGIFNAPNNQVMQIGWNQAGLGEGDFFDQSGTATGGFNWYRIAGSTITGSPGSPIMQLSTGGNLTTTSFNGVPLAQTATQPTGSCSAIAWVLSNDGHITFCNGTTYVSKV